jgi:hypothetical protein
VRRVEREAPELLEPIRSGEMTINAAVEKIKDHTAAIGPAKEKNPLAEEPKSPDDLLNLFPTDLHQFGRCVWEGNA